MPPILLRSKMQMNRDRLSQKELGSIPIKGFCSIWNTPIGLLQAGPAHLKAAFNKFASRTPAKATRCLASSTALALYSAVSVNGPRPTPTGDL